MVGGGILSLPYGFKSCGLGLGIFLLIFMGVLSSYTAVLLSKAGKTFLEEKKLLGNSESEVQPTRSSSNQITLGVLASHLYGDKGGKAICLLLVLLLQFSHVGYLVLLGDLTSPVLKELLKNV